MIRVIPLLVVLTLLVLLVGSVAGPFDPPPNLVTMQDLNRMAALLDTFDLTAADIWVDPLPDSTVIALRLALKHLDPHIVDMFTPGFIDEASTLRWRADQLDKKQRDIALIKRVLRAWEARP